MHQHDRADALASFQIKAARNALLHYVATSGNHQFIDGKMIFLQGSPS